MGFEMLIFNTEIHENGVIQRFVGQWSGPVPVAARSKAWVCGRSLDGIVGSNPTGGMEVCLL